MEKEENQKRMLFSDLNMNVMFCVQQYVLSNANMHRKRKRGKERKEKTVLRRGVLGIASLLPPLGYKN